MNLTAMISRLTLGRAMMLGLSIAVIYYFMLYDDGSSLRQSIDSSRARLGQIEKEMRINDEKLQRAAVFKKTAEEVGSTIGRLVTIVPEKFSMPDLMRLVSNESKVAGSSLSAIRPAGTMVWSVAKEFEEVALDIELVGSFLQHMVFLSNLTKLHQILIVRRYDMAAQGDMRSDEAAVVKMSAQSVADRARGPADGNTPRKGP